MKKLLALSLIVLAACSGSKKIEKTETDLSANFWYLTTIYSGPDTIHVPDKIASLRFEPEKKTINGKGGCNQFGGRYTLSGETVHFSNMYSTKMYCHEYQAIEDKYLASLEEVDHYVLAEKELILYKGKELVLMFVK